MAEKLENEFTVNRPIDEAWPLICDLEKIAPCMPGAQLEEIEGDVYRGNVAIKLGAVATKFKGEASFVERDDTNHTARLRAQGRDTKGRGNAAADITATAVALSPTSTQVNITTDLSIAGKVAQFGRGIMADLSKKLIDEFASNLNQMIDEEPSATADTANTDAATTGGSTDESSAAASGGDGAGDTPAAESATASGSSGTSTATDAGEEKPRVRKIDGPAAEPISVGSLAGGAIAKRAIPLVIGFVAAFFILRRVF